jgi:hypothetical protein
MVSGRRAVLVQDEFEIPKDAPVEVTWAMTTDAAIRLQDSQPAQADLRLKGKRLTATILAPAGAAFTVESAGQFLPQDPNAGVSRLVIRLPSQVGTVRVAVLLTPVWPDGKSTPAPALRPLAAW